MKRWLAFLFVLTAVWLLAATPERKVVFPFAATFTNNSLNNSLERGRFLILTYSMTWDTLPAWPAS